MSNTNEEDRDLDLANASTCGFGEKRVRCWCEFTGDWEKEVIIWRWDEPSPLGDILGQDGEWQRIFSRKSHEASSADYLTIPNKPEHRISGWYKQGPPNGGLPWIQTASPRWRQEHDYVVREVLDVYEFNTADGGTMKFIFATPM